VLQLQTANTTALTVDTSANVGIGTTSPAQKLDVNGSAYFGPGISTGTGLTTGDALFELGGRRTGSGPAYIDIHSTASSDYESRILRAAGADGALQIFNTGLGEFQLQQVGSAPFTVYTNATERMRIDSSGNVGIGTTSPSTYANSYAPVLVTGTGSNFATIQARSDGPSGYGNGVSYGGSYSTNPINGARMWIGAAGGSGQRGGILFFTKDTDDNTNQPAERMRITSGGGVCINTTANLKDSTERLSVYNGSANGVSACFQNTTSGTTTVLVDNTGTGTAYLLNWYSGGSFRASITWNGSAIVYGTGSDQRLKTNIVDSSSALPKITSIKVRSFDWIESGKHTDFGVIAQELKEVAPDAVIEPQKDEDGNETTTYCVDTSTLIPMLIKAIQELKAELDELKAKVNA
jgi:hypothetical protein